MNIIKCKGASVSQRLVSDCSPPGKVLKAIKMNTGT